MASGSTAMLRRAAQDCLCQASAEHLQQCAEFLPLRNRGLGPLAVPVLPIALARRGRRYRLRRRATDSVPFSLLATGPTAGLGMECAMRGKPPLRTRYRQSYPRKAGSLTGGTIDCATFAGDRNSR